MFAVGCVVMLLLLLIQCHLFLNKLLLVWKGLFIVVIRQVVRVGVRMRMRMVVGVVWMRMRMVDMMMRRDHGGVVVVVVVELGREVARWIERSLVGVVMVVVVVVVAGVVVMVGQVGVLVGPFEVVAVLMLA